MPIPQGNHALLLVTEKVSWLIIRGQKMGENDLAAKGLAHEIAINW
jgi:hypothetical protein